MTISMTQSAAIADILDTYDALEREDIANYGCASGTAYAHIYYQQTWEYFLKFEDEIEDYFYDMLGDDYIADLTAGETSIRGIVNKLVWAFVESVCSNY